MINEKHSFTEYKVTKPTSTFHIGFSELKEPDSSIIVVYVNDVVAEDAGYTVQRVNDQTVKLTPSVDTGIVRLQRDTDIDSTLYVYTAGALFEARTMDANFKQIIHSQQEVKDRFVYTTDYISRVLNGYTDRIEIVESNNKRIENDLKVEVVERKQGDIDSRRYAEDLLGMGNFWDGITARSVYDSVQGNNQAELNDLMGLPYHVRDGGYKKFARVMLDNGDMVVCTDPHAGTNPNMNMLGWMYESVVEKRAYAPVLGSKVVWDLDHKKATLIYGLSDPTHLDDNMNHFRGLNNPNAYDPSNRAIGAVSFGRNNPAFAYLSVSFGHDCVPYGVASLVGGAGSATGNPDVPNDGANYGYCSLAVGKDTRAGGRISNAMGERNVSETRYSSTDGYNCYAGKALPEHPDYSIHGDDGSEGAAARAHGYASKAFGNFAFSYGTMLEAYNGAQLIGKGINEGSKLKLSRRGLGLGYNVDVPTIFLKDGGGVNGKFAPIAFNGNNPQALYEFNMGKSDSVCYNIVARGDTDVLTSTEYKGTFSDGTQKSLHNFVVTHPNVGTQYASAVSYINGTEYMRVLPSRDVTYTGHIGTSRGVIVAGDRIIGGQMPAIADLPPTATLADVIAKINTILATLRAGTGHGIIAS